MKFIGKVINKKEMLKIAVEFDDKHVKFNHGMCEIKYSLEFLGTIAGKELVVEKDSHNMYVYNETEVIADSLFEFLTKIEATFSPKAGENFYFIDSNGEICIKKAGKHHIVSIGSIAIEENIIPSEFNCYRTITDASLARKKLLLHQAVIAWKLENDRDADKLSWDGKWVHWGILVLDNDYEIRAFTSYSHICMEYFSRKDKAEACAIWLRNKKLI